MGAWYVYFAAAPSREIKFDLFQHRMYAISCSDANPLTGEWIFEGKIDSGIDAFCLDATTFTHSNELYYVWAQKELDVRGNSNLMIAKMETPTKLATKPVRLSKPEYDWEIQGFWVNEGPSIVKHGSRIFISYSGSATDERYAMGILWAEQSADLLDPASWTKSVEPVLVSEPSEKVFGPGHNSFTVDEEGNDMLVYHARNYTEIEGDPLWDPNRHTYVKKLRWDETGMPIFGSPAFEE